MMIKTIIFLLFFSLPIYGYAGIYTFVDERGVFHFTNIIPVGKKYRIIVPEKTRTLVSRSINDNYDSIIMQHSRTHGIDPSLIKAVMQAESNFNPRAISPKGAQGLMQLMPDTARLMKVDDPFDPDDNIRGGTKYLKMLDKIFDGNLELVLAAYNAGPSRVFENKMNVPPIEETKSFIKRVKQFKQFYNKQKRPDEG